MFLLAVLELRTAAIFVVQPPRVASRPPSSLNQKASEGWRLVAWDSNYAGDKMLFVLERDKERSKETVLLRQLLHASGHEPEA